MAWLRPDETREPHLHTSLLSQKPSSRWVFEGELTTLNGSDWILVNPGRKALFRVAYSPALMERLRREMEEGEALSSLERFQLLDDAFSLAEAGRGSYADAVRLSKSLERETAYLPWRAALAQLSARLSTPIVTLQRPRRLWWTRNLVPENNLFLT